MRLPRLRAFPGSEEVLQNLGDEKNLPEFFEHGGARRLNRRGASRKFYREFSSASPDHLVTAGSLRGQPQAVEKISIFDCGGVHHNRGHGGINPHQNSSISDTTPFEEPGGSSQSPLLPSQTAVSCDSKNADAFFSCLHDFVMSTSLKSVYDQNQ